jgi:hypothetical protein
MESTMSGACHYVAQTHSSKHFKLFNDLMVLIETTAIINVPFFSVSSDNFGPCCLVSDPDTCAWKDLSLIDHGF